MDKEIFEQKEDEILKSYKELAWSEFKKFYSPYTVNNIKAPTEFGAFLHEDILSLIDGLTGKYRDNLSSLITLAVREFDYACYKGSCFVRLCIEAEVMNDNDFTRIRSSPEGYAADKGFANTIYYHLTEIDKPQDYLTDTPFLEVPDTIDLLEAISLFWYVKAANHFSNKEIKDCFMYLHEAYEARMLSDYESTFQMITEDYEQKKSFAARRAAKERLKRDPKQREKKFVLDCWVEWQAKPSNYLSKAEFARDMLQKCTYLKSNKKIEDWCREWEQEKDKILNSKDFICSECEKAREYSPSKHDEH